MEESKVVSAFSIRNYKFLGFVLGKGKNGVYIRVRTKSLKEAKANLKELTSRNQGRNVRKVMKDVNWYVYQYPNGWLFFFQFLCVRSAGRCTEKRLT